MKADLKNRYLTATSLGQICLSAGLASVLTFLGPQTGTAQTIDCNAPVGPVAQIICGDPLLTDLDLDMGDAFREMVRASPRSERPTVLRSQRDWLDQRSNCLGQIDISECIRRETEGRISDLSQGLADPSAAEPLGPREEVKQAPLPTITRGGQPPSDRVSSGSGLLPPRLRDSAAPKPGAETAPLTGPRLTTQGTETANMPPLAQPPGQGSVAPQEAPAPLNSADSQALAEFLSASVWRAEIASGIRPGTIFMFYSNGLLITADCVEAYRIGTWRIEGNGLRIEEGSGRSMTAEVLESGDGYVRLKLTERRENREFDIVFRTARGPFACTS